MYDTITVYPKYGQSDFFERQSAECNQFGKSSLGILRFVHRKDVDHSQYHQDQFNLNNIHYHAQFDTLITEQKFDTIVTAFLHEGWITELEKSNLLDAYCAANVLNIDEYCFNKQLALLTEKANALRLLPTHEYDASIQQIRTLYTELKEAVLQYCNTKSTAAYDRFHQHCFDAIATAEPALSHLQGYKNDLIHLKMTIALFDVSLSKDEKNSLLETYRQATIVNMEDHFFNQQLVKLRIKAYQLKNTAKKDPAHYGLAATKATVLYEALDDAFQTYCMNKTNASYVTFKNTCNKAITTAREELEKHRGSKQIFGNFVLAIALLGVGYIAAGLLNLALNGRFLFFKTDSAHRVDKVETRLAGISIPP